MGVSENWVSPMSMYIYIYMIYIYIWYIYIYDIYIYMIYIYDIYIYDIYIYMIYIYIYYMYIGYIYIWHVYMYICYIYIHTFYIYIYVMYIYIYVLDICSHFNRETNDKLLDLGDFPSNLKTPPCIFLGWFWPRRISHLFARGLGRSVTGRTRPDHRWARRPSSDLWAVDSF